MSKETSSHNESWIFKIFFLGSLMKMAGDLVGQVVDVLGIGKRKK